MLSCEACNGFIPGGATLCPNCGAEHPAASKGIEADIPEAASIWGGKLAVKALGAATMMATLMACYGMPADDCFSNGCPTGTFCADNGSCISEDCSNGVDDNNDGLVDADDPLCASVTCGDAVLSADTNEQCDDGNLSDDDGCSASCQIEYAIFCEQVPELALGNMTVDLADGTNAFVSSCVTAAAPEVVLSFTAPANGDLTISAAAQNNVGLYILDGCDDPELELGCEPATGTSTGDVTAANLAAGQTVYVVVDTSDPYATGTVDLFTTFVSN